MIIFLLLFSSFFSGGLSNVFGLGSNRFGELGIGDESLFQTNVPIPLPKFIGTIQSGSAGFQFSLLLTDNHDVFSFGFSSRGQLGLNTSSFGVFLPQKINPSIFQDKIIQITAGNSHTIFLSEKGFVYVVGSNAYNQLGLDSDVDLYSPQLLELNHTKIVDVAAGLSHTILLAENNQVFVLGSNLAGQLCHPDIVGTTFIKKIDFSPFLPDGSRFIRVFAGNTFTMFLTDSGTIYGCGENRNGQLGVIGTNIQIPTLVSPNFFHSKIQNLCLGHSHTLALGEQGEVYGLGLNLFGQLGIPPSENIVEPTQLDSSLFGREKIEKVFCGSHSSAFLTETNKAYVAGKNIWGMFGTLETSKGTVPFNPVNETITSIILGDTHALILTKPENSIPEKQAKENKPIGIFLVVFLGIFISITLITLFFWYYYYSRKKKEKNFYFF